MRRKVSLHLLAEQELNEAAFYYDQENPGLGSTFLDDVEGTIDRILDHPEAGALVEETVRRRLVPRFPYAVLYSVREDEVRILAIMNQKRRPFYWRDRS